MENVSGSAEWKGRFEAMVASQIGSDEAKTKLFRLDLSDKLET
jgi:hypothetical protein